jgi:urea transporter/murein DD-endopeptidase MepM/ murein hydrolase activator NlpD
MISNGFALSLGFSKEAIRSGDFGFNSLLVGLGLGFYYAPNIEFAILIVVGALITFLFTVAVSGVLYKYGLPFLSIPFLLALWALMLASRNFTGLTISERGIYTLNELYATGSSYLVNAYQIVKTGSLPEIIRIYFNSLGAILFQFNILSGILVALGLLIYSRIAFLFSFLSFASAYYFYQILGADIATLSYHYIGFNFILSGIALGGYFLVPSKTSILWTIILVPMLMILTSSLGSLFATYQLNIYSLPFNIVVITFLYVLKLRKNRIGPKEVLVQHHSPEHNLYHNLSGQGRFKHYRPLGISLPVFGNWTVSQAHDGKHTHRGEWKEAWDFVIIDKHNKQYTNEGKNQEDFYCYGKPVIAPADGVIEQIVNDVDDNLIGDSNLVQNWGNSIVIKHDYQLYSQLSHLKKDSIKVKKGDKVKSGEVLALCGNSGRSPEPHLHFQIQSTPFVGSKTLKYPLSNYAINNQNDLGFEFFNYPKEMDIVNRLKTDPLLHYAFHFLPGQIIKFNVKKNENSWNESWEVKTDYYNNSYLECLRTKSKAYFQNDGILFYFTQFEGSKKSLLYSFFLGAFRVLQSEASNLELTDEIPLHLFLNSRQRFFQDFFAPFYPIIKAQFSLTNENKNNQIGEESVSFHSNVKLKGSLFQKKNFEFKMTIKDYRIEELVVMQNNVITEAKWAK